jgi:hypothetical protein
MAALSWITEFLWLRDEIVFTKFTLYFLKSYIYNNPVTSTIPFH